MRSLALLAALTCGSALAFTVPFENWEAQPGGAWQGGDGACLVREEVFAQPFPLLATREDALAFAARLQEALYAQKLEAVVAQPVERPGQWGVLASYALTQGDQKYQVAQLYLSTGGKLRTFTGSYQDGAFDQCVNDLRTFVRYLAN